jgi:predicted RNase H-like HicB family nuclease
MGDRLEDFMRLSYSIKVVPDQTTEGSLCYVASHPELPGCMSHGDTPEEAIDNLSEAKELYIKTLLEKGESIPLPKSSTVAIWQIAGAQVGSRQKSRI